MGGRKREKKKPICLQFDLSWMQNFKVWIGDDPSSTVFIRMYNIHCTFWKVL